MYQPLSLNYYTQSSSTIHLASVDRENTQQVTMTNRDQLYDFIVVGAGPAGCSVATHIARTAVRPRVLLLEVGHLGTDPSSRMAVRKFDNLANAEILHQYTSTPQDQLGGRELALYRGKAVGGSTLVNFSAWTKGPKDDWEEISETIDDKDWDWANAQRRWKALENYHSDTPAGMEGYLCPRAGIHGSSGPLHVSHSEAVDHHLIDVIDTWKANGYSINPDIGSGSPLGVSISPVTEYRGIKSTAADLLTDAPPNLHLQTGSAVRRLLFGENKVAGVELIDGQQMLCVQEVILCAGTFDTPKILLHSGIGPATQLSRFGIKVIHNNPYVGKNLCDHSIVPLGFTRSQSKNSPVDFFRDEIRQKSALEEWNLYRTGEYTKVAKSMVLGYFKSQELLTSSEFAALPEEERRRLCRSTTPHYQIATSGLAPQYLMTSIIPDELVTIYVVLLNGQARGSVELQSGDPSKPAALNPNFLNHPFDRRAAVEATKAATLVTGSQQATEIMALTPIDGMQPLTQNDADILSYWRENCTTINHPCGTCRVGKSQAEDEAVVDSALRVFGVNGLRIADASVLPFAPK